MAIELLRFPKMDDQMAIQLAASQGIRSMENLISFLSSSNNPHQTQLSTVDCTKLTDVTVSRFKKVISLLDRTGHARFRRGPVQQSPPPPPPPPPAAPRVAIHQVPAAVKAQKTTSFAHNSHPKQSMTLDFTKPSGGGSGTEIEFTTTAAKLDRDSSSFISVSSSCSSAITGGGDGSVNNGKLLQLGTVKFLAPEATVAGNAPITTPNMKRPCMEHDHSEGASGKHSGSGESCHCSNKKRKHRTKKVVRVPAISNKVADIPVDEHSWRKYGQKPIKGSAHPRGYYRCSTVRGCPARKHVERATDDPAMLVVTYEGDHHHSHRQDQAATMAPAAASAPLTTLLPFKSTLREGTRA